MKKRALRKEFFMEIRKSLPRFLSILFIVALGTAFYSGIQSSSPDMRYSGDAYFDAKELSDIQVTGTMGVTGDDVEALQNLKDIETAEGVCLKDVLTGEEGQRKVLRILSIPEKSNLVTVEEGEYPTKEDECLMDVQYAEHNGYQIGDTFRISEELEKDEDATLKSDTFTITGLCSSPLYISFSRGSTNVGNGEIAGFVYVPQETFTTDYYMQIYLKVKGAKELTAYTDAYDTTVAQAKEQVESIEKERCIRRQEEIKDEAQEKVSDARKELADKKAEADQKLADAKKEIDDAKKKLKDGKTELADKEKELNDGKKELAEKERELDDAQQQITDGRTQLQSAENQLAEKESEFQKQKASAEEQISTGEKELANGLKSLQKNQKTFAQQKAAFEQQKQTYLDGVAQYEENLARYENSKKQGVPEAMLTQAKAELDAAKTQLDAAGAQITAGEKQLNDAQNQLDAAQKKLDENQAKIDQARQQLKDGEEQLSTARSQLNEKKAQLNASQAQLDDGKRQIADAKQKLEDGQKQIEDAKATIAKNEKKLAKGERKYEKKKAKAEKKIAKAEKKIDDAQKEVDDIKEPEWTVEDRSDLLEYTNYGDNAERMKSIGEVFPVLFFLVAALISLTTMTRMVEEERTQIGTMKALGYSKVDIAAKYLLYALFATVGGSVLGILAGEKILPYIIIRSYGIMYLHMNMICIPYNMKFALIAAGAAIFCTMIATLEACIRELHAWPAVLMRPPAPKEGKRILIERIGFIWKHLSFSWKSSMRNLFRYKKRLFMTIFGIAGSMGLMLVGFGLYDSIMDIAILQYDQIQHYDAMVINDDDATQSQKKELLKFLDGNSEIDHYTRVQLTKMTAPKEKGSVSIYVYVPENTENFKEDVTLRDRKSHEQYELTDDGAVICEKTASLIGVKAGDEIALEKDNRKYKVKITAVTENYMGHYVYMTPSCYEKTFGEKPEYSSTVYTMKEDAGSDLETLGNEILKYPAALSISYTSSTAGQVERMLGSLGAVIWVLIISAGMLAFVVLYNLNNINITERQRELATLKVLGFYDGEVSQYVFRENILLSFIGILAGAVFGILLHRYVITTVEVDAVMFGRNIKPISFVYSGIITFGFSMFVNMVMHFKLKKINMVESLKSVE